MGDRSGSERRSYAPPAARPAATSSLAPAAGHYTTALLVQRYGRCEAAVVERYVAGASAEALVASGARAATARIVRDGARIVGAAGAFVATASPEQRALLPMFTPEFVTAAVTSVAIVEEQQAVVDRRRMATRALRRTSGARAGKLAAQGQARRRVLHAGLMIAAAGDASWKVSVDEATGSAEKPHEIAASLERQVDVGRKLMRRAAAQGVTGGLDEAYFQNTLELAAKLRDAGREADATPAAEGATQGEVDRLGGVCLWFIKGVIDMFDAAHEADPSVPKMQVMALRSVLKRGNRRAKRPSPPTPPAPPAPPNG